LFTDAPEIEVERPWVHSGEGFEAELVCSVHADPPAEVSSQPLHYFILKLLRNMGNIIQRKTLVALVTGVEDRNCS